MNPTHDEETLIRWLDGELDDTERARFEARLEADPALKAEALEMQKLTQAVRQNLPQPGDIPHADFFNSQIQREIEDLRAAQQRPRERQAPVLRWWRLPWLIAASAALVAVFAIMKPGLSGTSTEVVSSYAPNPEVHVRVVNSTEGEATVMLLEGVPEIPASTPMVGFKVHRTESDPQMSMTTLFSEAGDVLLVMARDANHQPKVYAR
jgi:hypothetical protein